MCRIPVKQGYEMPRWWHSDNRCDPVAATGAPWLGGDTVPARDTRGDDAGATDVRSREGRARDT
ncbi:hypothetical protein M404DRAFT_1006862 [Pisolithus tinctorius Marx 270]|uniref:Uncharacterized protein n=1 Tax=Pisolithus tinctorius Marx 270 TaxID=870435 RepID=A0A0C3N596_PISTI|nr:hypothetical protein M404DRAFT_1006862 [Pisolithus tinctorius Marx 270]